MPPMISRYSYLPVIGEGMAVLLVARLAACRVRAGIGHLLGMSQWGGLMCASKVDGCIADMSG